MAVQPSQTITEILSATLGGRPANNARADRSGGQPPNSSRSGRILPEPPGGYDPKAPRGTYVNITA